MATPLPLNTFRTVTATVETTLTSVYTTPDGVSTVVLGAQCANVTDTATTVTFIHSKDGTDTELLKDFDLPANDAVNLVSGKLVLESGSVVKIQTGTNLSCKLTLSILETSNE